MRLDRNKTFAGLTALEVRRMMRRLRHRTWSYEALTCDFELEPNQAADLLSELQSEGLIEQVDVRDEEQWFETTTKGNAFAMASAGRPISRTTADKLLEAFLERVQAVNSDESPFAYVVDWAAIFGSYLEKERVKIGDVDIAVHLAPRFSLQDEQKRREEERRDIAQDKGRQFSNFTEWLIWPQWEVRNFLKSRSRGLSLHIDERLDALGARYEIIYKLEGPHSGSRR